MKIKELFEAGFKAHWDNTVWDFAWDQQREGFYVTKNGEPLDVFFKAKSLFDRSGAQEEARQAAIRLRNEHDAVLRAKDEHKTQFEKPLNKYEQEFIELDNRFMSLNPQELKRWEQLAHANALLRQTIRDGKHPACKRTHGKPGYI